MERPLSELLHREIFWLTRQLESRVTFILSGGCRGGDALGETLAGWYDIPVKRYEANWLAHGKAAGPLRNAAMAEDADALIAIWDLQSKGTLDIIRRMTAQGKPVRIIPFVRRKEETTP